MADVDYWDRYKQRLYRAIYNSVVGIARLGLGHGKERLLVSQQNVVDWDLANTRVEDWARNYTVDMIEGLSRVTQDRLRKELPKWRDEVADWVGERERFTDLVSRINQIVDDPVRADAIATTEATRVYAEGNIEGWEEAGVAKAVFKPPAHVNCRCYPQPYKMHTSGLWVVVWYTARDERVCITPIQVPWQGRPVKGCKALHRTVISEGPHLGHKIRK